MAEQEVIKHTKKIYKTWFSKEHSFWHKLGEFGVEILIIVFAVTISIWFHNWSEHTHQQAEVKEFLEGLKLDLLSDIQEMKSDQSSYEGQKRIFNYLAALKIGSPVSLDSMRKHQASLFNNTALNPNDGRFQGFKSSGKIGLIENHDIQNDIMDLYEEDIPALLSSTRSRIISPSSDTRGVMSTFTIPETPSSVKSFEAPRGCHTSERWMCAPVSTRLKG